MTAAEQHCKQREAEMQMFGSCFILPSAPLAPAPLKHQSLMEGPVVTQGAAAISGRPLWAKKDLKLPDNGALKATTSAAGTFQGHQVIVMNKIRLQWHSKRGCQKA